MEVVWEIRKALLLGRDGGDPAASCRPDVRDRDAIRQLICGELLMQTEAPTAAELARAIAVAQEFGIRLLATDVRYVPRTPIAYRNIAILLAPPRLDELPELWSAYVSLKRQNVEVGILLDDVPLPTLLALSRPHATACGLTEVEMLAAFTAAPARILGAGTLGRLERGRSADFLVLSGSPFDPTTRIERVFIEGREVYARRERQR